MTEITIKEYASVNEKAYLEVLPNGLTVYVVPKRGFSKYCAYFAVNYGGSDRRFRTGKKWINTPQGVAHFLEHKMFDTPEGDASTRLAINGASSNAFTSTDMTAYYFDCIDMFRENLEILLNFVSVPYFTAENVEKEQGIIAQEILMSEDDPDYCLYYGLMKSLFRHNPARDSVAGSVESIAKITPETLYSCHTAFYNPSNMVLCVAGDIDPREVADAALRVLPEEKGIIPERDYGPPESLAPEATRFSAEMDVSLPLFMAGCKSEPATRDADVMRLDLVSALALDILAGHSSPLYFRLYKEGLVSSDFSASFDASSGAAYSMFGGETRDPMRVYNEVLEEVSRICKTGPDADLSRRIRKSATGSYVRTFNSFDAICGSITGSFFRGYDALDMIDLIPAVTDDEITAFLRERLDPANMAISIINPK